MSLILKIELTLFKKFILKSFIVTMLVDIPAAKPVPNTG